MKAIVTVFKSELNEREYVKGQLNHLCKQIIDTDEAVIFCPVEGKLVEFLSVMRFHKVAYGTHFETTDTIQHARPAPVKFSTR
jgi:hypothetical protein